MKEDQSIPGPCHILYPPGGLLVWALVAMELLTFGVALIAFMISENYDSENFRTSREFLNPKIGFANTLILLSSGYIMALSVTCFKRGEFESAGRFLYFTLLGGLLFCLLKGIEYHDKISHGHTLGFDTFFTYYWLLTVFHLMHIVVGMVILLVMRRNLSQRKFEDFEASGVFWHMCDLIWLLLFPSLYLIS